MREPTALPCPLRAVFSDDNRWVVETVGEVVRLSPPPSQRGQSFPRVQGTPQPDDGKALKFWGSFLTIARSFLDNDRSESAIGRQAAHEGRGARRYTKD